MLYFQSLAAVAAAAAAARRGEGSGRAVLLRAPKSVAAAAASRARRSAGQPEAAAESTSLTPAPAAAAASSCATAAALFPAAAAVRPPAAVAARTTFAAAGVASCASLRRAAAGRRLGAGDRGLGRAAGVGCYCCCCCNSAWSGGGGGRGGAAAAAALQQQQRQFGTGGSYGYDVFFRGAAEVLNSSNVRLPHFPEEKAAAPPRSQKLLALLPKDDAAAAAAAADPAAWLRHSRHQQQTCSSRNLQTARLPIQVHLLGSPYFFQKHRQTPLTFYQHRVDSGGVRTPDGPAAGDAAAAASNAAAACNPGTGAPAHAFGCCCLLATAEAQQLHAKKLQNVVLENTRGFACQLLLQGRGVRAYFDPDWPDLMVRLGVGVKPLALRRLAEQYATRARIFVDQRGTVLTVHGYNKRAVGTLAMALFNLLQANPYTMKGAHVAFHPIKKKTPKKK